MTKRLLINGAGGRIGRGVTYEVINLIGERLRKEGNSDLQLVALNDPVGRDKVIGSYNARDPVHGIYDWNANGMVDGKITLFGTPYHFSAEKDVSKIPFKDMGIDMVLECSGFYGDPKTKDKSAKLTSADNGSNAFLQQGVKKVIQTYPAKTADASIIMGVNQNVYDQNKHNIISNASCTTKALSMPLQVLLDNGVSIEGLSMDTTHAATASQAVLGSLSQIVTHDTGAAKATGLVIPSLEGKMTGMSYRVPTLDGSFANLYFVAVSEGALSAEHINNLMRDAVKNPKYAGRIGVFEGKDAGTFDIVGRRENGVVLTSKTNVMKLPFAPNAFRNAYLVTLISGYDNELGSAVDPVLLTEYIAKQ